ncbi:MAG: Acyl-CoA dehydrogenase, partial [Chloroflexi bacterium]|nr:Acyl-CoA dehydrogenase [Chloroflexota bacterium]
MTQIDRVSVRALKPKAGEVASILAVADQLGRDELAPRAQEMDERREPPIENFQAMARAGILGITVPVQFGGLGADGATVLQVTETFTRYCAVTAFLLVQHTGVCRSIAVGGSPIAADLLP